MTPEERVELTSIMTGWIERVAEGTDLELWDAIVELGAFLRLEPEALARKMREAISTKSFVERARQRVAARWPRDITPRSEYL